MESDHWNDRYRVEEYVYGTEPNGFVAESADRIPAGPVLCLAEGEGRNAVFLAGLGHAVTAVDRSTAGVEKARQLARARGVRIEVVAADLAEFDLGKARWSGIMATFAHLPPELRRTVHRRVVEALAPGGILVLEAYAPGQVAYRTGGPKDPALLMSLEVLREEFEGLDLAVARETERDVIEGIGHTGRGAVVQVLGRKPAVV